MDHSQKQLNSRKLMTRQFTQLGLVTILSIAGFGIFAQECDGLEGSAQTVCLTLMVCMSLDEEQAREQCLLVARQLLDKRVTGESESESEPEATEPSVSADSSIPGLPQDPPMENVAEIEPEPVAVPEPPQVVEPTLVPTKPESQQSVSVPRDSDEMTVQDILDGGVDKPKRRRFFGWLRGGGSDESKEPEPEPEIGYTIDGVPKQFASTVLDVNEVGYNESLIVLDNGYVFTIQRARQSNIKEGHVVVVQKKEGMSGRKSFRFYGQGASVDASRVLCEHVDPSRTTKRRCAYARRVLDE